jgi:hypothetical protein
VEDTSAISFRRGENATERVEAEEGLTIGAGHLMLLAVLLAEQLLPEPDEHDHVATLCGLPLEPAEAFSAALPSFLKNCRKIPLQRVPRATENGGHLGGRTVQRSELLDHARVDLLSRASATALIT